MELTTGAGDRLPESVLTGDGLEVRITVTTEAGAPLSEQDVQVDVQGQASLAGGGQSTTGITDALGRMTVTVIPGTAGGSFTVSARAGTVQAEAGPIRVRAQPTITVVDSGRVVGEWRRVFVSLATTGMTSGDVLQPWVARAGQEPQMGVPVIVAPDGSARWQRSSKSALTVYFTGPGGSRSPVASLPGR